MSGLKFSAAERYAVYTIHGSHCYLCGTPISLQTMRVDHVLPRSLKNDPERLSAILHDYGLPLEFNLDSFGNWLPACEPCNVAKGSRVFRPTPIVQVHIDRARSRAAKAETIAKQVVSDQSISKALNTLERALDTRKIDQRILDPLVRHYQQAAGPDDVHEFRVSPNYTVLYEGEAYRIVQAAYGVGYVPAGNHVDISFQCPHCGNYGPWSGARCVSCGHMIDD